MKHNLYDFLHADTTNLFAYDPSERIHSVTKTNAPYIFIANLITYFYNNWKHLIRSYQILPQTYTKKIVADLVIKGDFLYRKPSSANDISPFTFFAEKELIDFELFNTPESSIYTDYIKKSLDIFKSIDYLIDNKLKLKYTINLNTFLSHVINTEILDMKILEKTFNNFYQNLFIDHVQDLILYNKFQEKGKEEKLPALLDFDYCMNPSSLLTEEEHRTYKEAVLKWNVYVIGEISKKMSITYNPTIVQRFLDKLKSYISDTKESQKSISENTPKVENPNPDYPAYIFRNYKAYVLFHTIAQKMDSHTQISFLFRHMSEKENPPLIVVPNNQFVKWFNKEQYPVDLDYTTKTYLQSVSSERLAYYNIIKSFIFSD